MTTCTTKGSAEEEDAVRSPTAAAVAASTHPPSLCMSRPLPLPSWWLAQAWAVGGRQNGGAPASKANADGDGMDEDGEGPKGVD